jgi:hypothetical protein
LASAAFVVGNELVEIAAHFFTGRFARESWQPTNRVELIPKFHVPLCSLAGFAVLVQISCPENSHRSLSLLGPNVVQAQIVRQGVGNSRSPDMNRDNVPSKIPVSLAIQ